MALKAAGAYLWELRDMRGFSREAVAAAIGTNDVQVMRIEKGLLDTRGSLLLKFLDFVAGDADVLTMLMVKEAATEDEGRQFARGYQSLTSEEKVRVAEMRDRLGFVRFQHAIEVISSLEERGLVESLIDLQEVARGERPRKSRRARLPWRRSQSPETGS